MFNLIFQLSESMIFRIFNEMRQAALPVLPETLNPLDPVDLGDGISAAVVVNVPDTIFPLSLNEADQTVEIVLDGIQMQVQVRGPAEDDAILFDSIVSYVVRLPVSVNETEETIGIGSDPADFDANTVLAVIETGHPLEDDEILLELIARQLHRLVTSGGFPVTQTISDQPLEGLPLEVSAFIRLMNDVDIPGAIAASVELAPQPNHVVFVVPLEVWANLEVAGTDTVLQHVQALAELRVTVPVTRGLDPPGGGPAVVTVRLSSGETSLVVVEIVDGEDITSDPVVWNELQDFVRDRVGEVLRDFGDQTITVLSLDQMTALARDLLRTGLERDGSFIPFFVVDRNEDTEDATIRIVEDVLTIGFNAQANADITEIAPFIPDDRDFAVRLDGETVLEEISTLLVAPSDYPDIEGRLSLAALTPEGTSEIVVGGFSAESGTVRQRTRLRIDDFVYTVTSEADIARLPDDDASPAAGEDRNQATLSISPDIRSDLTAGERVRFEAGIGLPITEDAGGNDRTFRINDDLTPTLEEGHLRLAGTGRLRRPHAVIRNIDADVAIRLALDWQADTQVRGGGQNGQALNVRTLSETLRRYRAGSQVFVDDDRDPYGITADADAGDTTFDLSRDLDQSPADRGMVSSRWLQVGRVEGETQEGNTLRIFDMTEGTGLIPRGASLFVGGQSFRIEQDAPVDGDGNATVTLAARLDSELEDPPEDGAAVRISGGWWGRGTIDGADQVGNTVSVAGLVRYLPVGTTLSIAGMNGIFRTREEGEVVDDATTVAVDHLALDEVRALLPGEVEVDRLWDLLGQPSEGASVRRRSGGQAIELRRVGDVEVSLDTPLDGILGFLIGLLVALITPGGFVFRALIGGIVAALVRRGLRRRLQDEANDFGLDDFNRLPAVDQLDGVGVYLEILFNNPIDISPDGFLMAGQVAPSSVYPEVAESRARAMGPYDFAAGVQGQLLGSGPAPATEFTWLAGDGTVLPGVAPSHTYPRRGHYVAEYASLDAQLILERHTRELAHVRVRNTRPVLGTLPVLQGREGDEVVLTASFSDVAWLDAHRAIIDWGDDTLPDFAEIAEIFGPPVTNGTFTARHRYCDNGEFIVTVILEDAQGGTDRQETTARIVNVPPRVDAGEDMFAHPCVALRLVGRFTDPGWCDTHTGVWDFGDCSPLFPATIEETHTPPEGRGTATATHCYDGCGTWLATLTVTDDDGASGSDSIVIHKSELRNGGFEEGFARAASGDVGRFWTGYAEALTPSLASREVFGCEGCVVCDGARAQRVRASGFRVAGLHQTLGANPGWEYQFAAEMHVRGGQATGWIGIDPLGRQDRTAPEIVWRSVGPEEGWQGVSTRAVAEGGAVTVFVEFRDPGPDDLVVDCVTMQAYPCVHEPPEPDDVPETLCAHLADLDQSGNLGSAFGFAGFFFVSSSGAPLMTVTFGSPPGTRKLLIPDSDGPGSILVDLPGESGAVTATVSGPPGQRIELRALDADDGLLVSDGNSDGGVRELRVETEGIVSVELTSERRGTLHSLCAKVDGERRNKGQPLS